MTTTEATTHADLTTTREQFREDFCQSLAHPPHWVDVCALGLDGPRNAASDAAYVLARIFTPEVVAELTTALLKAHSEWTALCERSTYEVAEHLRLEESTGTERVFGFVSTVHELCDSYMSECEHLEDTAAALVRLRNDLTKAER